MDSQSIHPLRRFSSVEPDLVSATEAFKKLNHFMSVLPASLKKKIDEEIHWHVGAQLPFDSWFFGPNCIAIDANRFDGAVDDITLASFYEKVGMFLTKDMEGEKEFKKKTVCGTFCQHRIATVSQQQQRTSGGFHSQSHPPLFETPLGRFSRAG